MKKEMTSTRTQDGMNHFFNVGHAQRYGLNEAIVLNHLIFWSKTNHANNKNIHDGYVWTYNSVRALQEILPYFTIKQIRYAISKLVEQGIIKAGNYNKLGYDRTKWYAIIDESILQNCQMVVPTVANCIDKKGKPIPDNITYNITNNTMGKNQEEFSLGEDEDFSFSENISFLENFSVDVLADESVPKNEIELAPESCETVSSFQAYERVHDAFMSTLEKDKFEHLPAKYKSKYRLVGDKYVRSHIKELDPLWGDVVTDVKEAEKLQKVELAFKHLEAIRKIFNKSEKDVDKDILLCYNDKKDADSVLRYLKYSLHIVTGEYIRVDNDLYRKFREYAKVVGDLSSVIDRIDLLVYTGFLSGDILTPEVAIAGLGEFERGRTK